MMSCLLWPLKLRPAEKVFRIVVLDTGFTKSTYSNVELCEEDSRDFTGTGLKDNDGHGSHIANIIADRVNVDFCIIVVKWFDPSSSNSTIQRASKNAFIYIATLKDIVAVNFSASGRGFWPEEKLAIEKIIKNGAKVFVAIGNDGKDMDKKCDAYPACYKIPGLVPVGNKNRDGTIESHSNYGKIVEEWEVGVDVIADTPEGPIAMTGTSQATAVATAKYVNSNK